MNLELQNYVIIVKKSVVLLKRGNHKSQNKNPTRNAHFDNEGAFPWTIRVLDAEVGAKQSTCYADNSADNAPDKSWIHIAPFILRFDLAEITVLRQQILHSTRY